MVINQLLDLILTEEMKHLEIQLEHPVSALILTSMGYLSDALWAAG